MANFSENMYRWMKRQDRFAQFEHPGIYQIAINNKVAYVGKSENMLWRLAQHYAAVRSGSKEHKYQILAEAKRRGYPVVFSVLCYANSPEELGRAEGEYIRMLRPPLNTQIPQESDWRKYEYNSHAQNVTLDEILAL